MRMCLSSLAYFHPPFVNPKTSAEQLQVDMVALWLGGQLL